VPTLRNVDKRPDRNFVKSFMHNGVFRSLKEVVDFYNTRDVKGSKWPPPEHKMNINRDELGDLKLAPEEVDLIVLFMKALTDK
jgi:cytochrome c peroxidase